MEEGKERAWGKRSFDVDRNVGLCAVPTEGFSHQAPRQSDLCSETGSLLGTRREIRIKKIVLLPVGSIWRAQWHPHVPV